MIRVAALEGRPLLRLALERLVDGEPDLVAVGFAADRRELAALLYRCDPDATLGIARREVAARLAAMLPRLAPA